MAYERISFTSLVRHALLDQFEFSAHSFYGLHGSYWLNAIGIDFESPMSDDGVLI